MSLHYSDESRKPRECERCGGAGMCDHFSADAIATVECCDCHGTGTVNAGEQPDIDVYPLPDPHRPGQMHYIARKVEPGSDLGALLDLGTLLADEPTEADALAAARKAIRGESQ